MMKSLSQREKKLSYGEMRPGETGLPPPGGRPALYLFGVELNFVTGTVGETRLLDALDQSAYYLYYYASKTRRRKFG